MQMRLVLALLLSLSFGHVANARELGLPLVKPLPQYQAFSLSEYAKALRGEASSVQINCTPADHAAAYRLFLTDATAENLPLLMGSLEVRPFPPGAKIRATALDAQTCKPFFIERRVHPGEGCIFSTNLGMCIGSAWCANAAEVLEVPVPKAAPRAVQVARTPYISETGDGLVWDKAFGDCPDDNQCGKAWNAGTTLGASALGAAGFVGGMAVHRPTRVKSTVSNAMSSVVNSTIQQPPPDDGEPHQPAPDEDPAQPAPDPYP